MKILLLCRWKLSDVLTASAVMPHLVTLIQSEKVDKVVFVTLEESTTNIITNDNVLAHHKVQWIPVVSVPAPFKIIRQVTDMLLHANLVATIVAKNNIEAVVAHGAPAGALAYKVWQKTKVPFYVSSFEPHADYMFQSGVWKKTGLKYIFQKHWEHKQKQKAAGLMPVAENYRIKLLGDGVSADKIFTVPCAVNAAVNNFSQSDRNQIREQLNWQKATIGIYVGKYEGLYYREEAFLIYQKCFKLIKDFRLIILSPQDKDEILEWAQKYGLNPANLFIATVTHAEVSQYLSAADFAFATIKSYAAAKHCSPIKIGEYWANGLPVLLTEGVGDDSAIIKAEGGGALFNLTIPGSVETALEQLKVIIATPNHRQEIRKLAIKYRSPERIREAYEYFFGEKEDA